MPSPPTNITNLALVIRILSAIIKTHPCSKQRQHILPNTIPNLRDCLSIPVVAACRQWLPNTLFLCIVLTTFITLFIRERFPPSLSKCPTCAELHK